MTRSILARAGVTAWLVDGDVMHSIASTKLGNAIIEIPVGAGLAGECASTGADVVIPDAYQDSRFNDAVDKVTGYRTKSVLCVPLKRPRKKNRRRSRSMAQTESTQLVLQLLNKVGHDLKPAAFTEEDAATLRTALEQRFVDVCDLIALTAKKGIRKSFADYLMEDGSNAALHGLKATAA